MAIASRPDFIDYAFIHPTVILLMIKRTARFLSFSHKLFLLVIALFLAFAVCFLTYQYQREKEFKRELLNTQLQNYNSQLANIIYEEGINEDKLSYIIRHNPVKGLRVTIIRTDGKVMYDNTGTDWRKFNNHSNREEIKKAITAGHGYSISRHSESLGGEEFFYSATYYPQSKVIVRSALPYDIDLTESLKADSGHLWFIFIICLVIIVVFYRFSKKLGTSITKLQQFALKAEKNEPIDIAILDTFPNNELGEISQHIIKIYKRLHKAKEDLYIEREKLITHLQTSHEGLGVFTKERKEILVNNLFTQYANIISDHNLSSTESIFLVSEFQPIISFLDENKQSTRMEERRLDIHINKNARSFAVECIIFQDFSFEISINDITQKEEQVRMKRQLTQNIAHELKTPVSSIQGYLETIVNSTDIPSDKLRTFIERCYAQSNRLTFLLRDISVLTRMDEATSMIEMEQLNLSTIVANILDEVTLELEKKHIKVNNQLPVQLPIKGNSSLLYSIFSNLTDNAIAYAGTGITITIKCFRQNEKSYYFSFSDTGIGIGEKHLNRIFERFYRVDKGRSRKLGGTGLGLAIVKNAIVLHGGSIFAKNNPNGGLEFIFTLQKNVKA